MAPRDSQGMVAVSPPSSFVTDGGLPAATPPILVVKSKDDIEKWAQFLPILTSALFSQAGRTGAAKLGTKMMGRVGAAKNARAASKAGVVPKGGGSNTLNALRGKPYTDVAHNPVKIQGWKQGQNTPGLNLPEGHTNWESYLDTQKPVTDLTNPSTTQTQLPNLFDNAQGNSGYTAPSAPSAPSPTGQQMAGARRQALQTHIDEQKLTTPSAVEGSLPKTVEPFTGEEKSMMATGGVGIGSAGIQSMQARSQENQAKFQQEQDRIQQVAQQARSKAGTTTGQVGVSA